MIRDITALRQKEYDLIIVGAGIFGACAAWDAALRGLSVAVVDKGDFSHATSANHYKMVHGGIRYLQHGDIVRIRESSRERSALLRIAPHLVNPLPIVIPTYGYGLKGKTFLGTGLLMYDILTADRNRGIMQERMIPRGQFMSRAEVLNLFPGIKKEGLTGGVVFCDGQVYNPPRLALSFLRSAVIKGADAANYIEVQQFIKQGDRIVGVEAEDTINGGRLAIRGKWILNTAGPWAHRLLESQMGMGLKPRPTFSRDLAFVVKQRYKHEYALAFVTQTKDADSIFDRGGRHLFAVPWRDYTLIGVWHRVFKEAPEKISVTKDEMQEFIDEVNAANTALDIHLDDILMINTGLTLFGSGDDQEKNGMSFGKRSRLVDHGKENGIEGITTLIGVRATTARGMAQKVVDSICRKLDLTNQKCSTERHPIYGGQKFDLNTSLRDINQNCPFELPDRAGYALVRNYGCEYHRVFHYARQHSEYKGMIGDSTVMKAEVVHAVKEEMAQTLSDVVFRRTDLSTGSNPGYEALSACCELMAPLLNWDRSRRETELHDVLQKFPAFSP